MDIKEIFENLIKIEPKVMSIETLFNNEERVNTTNYKPSYQRNYVWDDEKATYFIESILLGTEIPPLIYFRNSNGVEVVDGRQRYQTILRFKDNGFKLKKNGLQKLENIGIANQYFRNLDDKLKNYFWNTKLRIIEFSFHSKNLVNDEIEEMVKKEIFKRYNSGITPLKPTDIDKAAYIEDYLNAYFKKRLQEDKVLFTEIAALLHFEKSNIEIILKKIRHLLVLHQIPIKYYSIQKDSIITKYFEFLSSTISEEETEEIYNGFIRKIDILKRLQKKFDEKGINYNRFVFECIYWALSVLEVEVDPLISINEITLNDLVTFINENIEDYKVERSSFSKELHNRYFVTSKFFNEHYNLDFAAYLQNNPEFKAKNTALNPVKKEVTSFDELRINKPEPSSSAIDDICRQMEKQKFLIRPPYQRNEVIDKRKSSSIIESILLGIKLPPIFVFQRNDDISEVLDGQQRLLSILGFMGKPYLDEENKQRYSNKNGYSLNLKNGILKNLNGKTFEQLSKDERDKIKNFDLWIIEIKEKNNDQFEQIDLFIRLNNKPYPIKEDTFEMWNSYISREIIETVKSAHNNNKKWFYLRKNNSRMEDENIYTSLIYLQYQVDRNGFNDQVISKHLDIYRVGEKIAFRVKSKIEISKILESAENKEGFIQACYRFEFIFLKKLKTLLADDDESDTSASNNLDKLFNKDNNRRTQQSFYALWYFLFDIPESTIIKFKEPIRSHLLDIFRLMDNVSSKQAFDLEIDRFKKQYDVDVEQHSNDIFNRLQQSVSVKLSDICTIHSGYNYNSLDKFSKQTSSNPYPYSKEVSFENFVVNSAPIANVSLDEKDENTREIFENKNKIIVRKIIPFSTRLEVGILVNKVVIGSNYFIITVNRHGFLPKFLVALLSSSLFGFYIKRNSSSLSGLLNINTIVIKTLPIAIIPVSSQMIFVRLIDYIQSLEKTDPMAGFFQRLIDGLTYELYFPDLLGEYDISFYNHLTDFSLDRPLDENPETIENFYKELSATNHAISSSIFKLLNFEHAIEIDINN